MRSAIRYSAFTLLGVAVMGVGVGCGSKGGAGPHEAAPRVDVPPRNWEPPLREREPVKPLPEPEYRSDVPLPPFDDVPLVGQRPPEQKAFVDAYEAVGRPRMMVMVNGTRGSGSGARDDLAIEDIDFDSMEKILTDWFAADGQVQLLSPSETRRPADTGAGQPQSTPAGHAGPDVFIRVRAQQTRQTRDEAAVRLVGEAVNADDGRSIGRAVVDVPPPLDKPQLNKYTRFLGRRLMDQMTGTWRAMASDRGLEREQDREARQRLRERELEPAPAPAPRPADDAVPQPMHGVDPRSDFAPAPPAARPAPTTRPSTPPDAAAPAAEQK